MSNQRKENLKSGAKSNAAKQQLARRSFIFMGTGAVAAIGVGAVGYKFGWFGSSASYETALAAASEMLEVRAREIGNASVLIHAVRGFGKNFKLADGSSAVDHLCSRYAAVKYVNGNPYVYFKREAEVHENSFLKTFLEAGVSMDQQVIANGASYKLENVAADAKALFRCDPQDLFKFDANEFRYDTDYKPPQGQPSGGRGELVHEHLPWGLIAFTFLIHPPVAQSGDGFVLRAQPLTYKGSYTPANPQYGWRNLYAEAIDLPLIIDRSLAEYETTCALGERDLKAEQEAPKAFRDAIKKYSCFGLHSVYAFLACYKHGYANNNLSERINRMLDLLTYRLKGDAEAINTEYASAGQGAPAEQVEAFRLRALVKHYGHAFESINYAKLHKLTSFNADQQRRISEGEAAFYDSLVKLHGLDWAMMKTKLGEKFVSDIIIAVGHAVRALKLLTPQNPDTAA